MSYLVKNRPINTFCARSTAASCQFSIKMGKGFNRLEGVKKKTTCKQISIYVLSNYHFHLTYFII